MRLPRSLCLLPVVLALLLPVRAGAQDASALATLIGTRIDGDLSGVCIAAARVAPATGGFTTDVATRCAGGARSLPASGTYRFEIGSISKAFTGVLLAEMIERGEVALDDPLQKYLPAGVTVPAHEGRTITLHDLVTHTSELPSLPTRFRPAGANPYASMDLAVLHGSLADVKLDRAPGQRYQYSNWGFMLLSDALGRRAGKPYDELLRERVLDPLGLRDTLVARNADLVPGHTSNGRRTSAWDIPAPFAGVGMIRSTPADMARFARAVLGDVPAGAPDTLKRALAAAPVKLRDGNRNVTLGMAWHRVRQGEAEYVFHNGMTGGFSASLVIDPQGRTAAVVLADAAGGFDDLAFRIVNPAAPLAPPRRAVPMHLATAEAAVGRYELRPGFVLEVTLVDGRLYSQASGQSRFELLQDSRGDFYPAEFDALLRFVRESDGTVSGVTLFQGGGIIRGKRIDATANGKAG